MRSLFIAFLILFLILGCIIPPQSISAVPSDTNIQYSYGACTAEWGRTNIQIDSSGVGIYERGSGQLTAGNRFSKEEFRKRFTLTNQELLALINGIQKSGFYSLQDDYSNLEIRDGSCSSIFVTMNDNTKSVSVSNMGPPQSYSTVADLILRLAQEKTS